jgi:uncharacterized membrane protein (GlpM family)
MWEETRLITHPYFIRSLRFGRAAFLLVIGALIVDLKTDLSRLIVYSLPTIIALLSTVSFILAGLFIARALGESRRQMIMETARSLLVMPYFLFLDAVNFWIRLCVKRQRR